MSSGSLSRRSFLSAAACAAAASAMKTPRTSAAPALGANEKLRVGFIGVGPQATWHVETIKEFPDVQVTAICEAWQSRLDKAIATVKDKHSPKPYRNYRELLADKNVDAVVIGTPPHWHTLMAVEACEAGKHVYLEKPMTLTLDESKAVVAAVRKHNIICQVGTQMHRCDAYRQAVDIVRSGRLGKITHVRTMMVMNQGRKGVGKADNTAPPQGLDWELWCGPGPMSEFNPLKVKNAYTHSAFMAYSGGWTPGMAPHILDLPYQALELDSPLITSSTGGRFLLEDPGDCPDTIETQWQYPGVTMTWAMSLVNSYGFEFQTKNEIRRRNAIYFHGENGTLLVADYGQLRVIPEGDRMPPAPTTQETVPPSPGHQREWVDCIRSGKLPSCNPNYHHKLNVACALSNLSLQIGRSIKFDPKADAIVGDAEATKLSRPEYRGPWKFPEKYVS